MDANVTSRVYGRLSQPVMSSYVFCVCIASMTAYCSSVSIFGNVVTPKFICISSCLPRLP